MGLREHRPEIILAHKPKITSAVLKLWVPTQSGVAGM